MIVLAGGCVAEPRIDIARDVADVAQIGEAIVISEVGGPIDEQWPTVQRLTLGDAISRSIRTDPQIQASIARVRIAQSQARQSRLLPNPVLSVVLRWPTGSGKPDIEAGLAADLVSLVSKPGRIEAADSRLRASAAEALSTALDVLAEVQARYAAVQSDDELLGVLADRVKIIDRLLDVARSRLAVGEGTRLDVLSLEAQRVELQAELAESHLERQDDRLRLARLMGEPSSSAEWQLTPWEPAVIPSASESRWVELGLENRPEVHRQRFELAALGQELKLTRFGSLDGAEVGVDAERGEGDWSIGPSITTPLPVFDFGQAQRDRARAAVVEARHNLTRVRRQIVEETRRAYAAFSVSRENLERVQKELIPLAQRRLEQAEAQFRGGQTDITGLLQAEQELRAARTRLVELERRNTEALIRLQRAVGGPSVIAGESKTAGSPSTRKS